MKRVARLGIIGMIILLCLSVVACLGEVETLLITSPKNNATVTTSSITVTGRVSGGAGQVAVNDVPVSTDKQTGQFSSIVELQQGENKIKITGKSGRRDILKYVTVFYQPA